MLYLSEIKLRNQKLPDKFPFCVPSIKNLPEIKLQTQVTFIVGENGSGKSTFMEALAVACNLPTIGSDSVDVDETLTAAKELANWLCLSWKKRTHRGFFLRAEDFFGFTNRTKNLTQNLNEIADRFLGDTEGNRRARGYILGQRRQLIRRYGENPDAKSHGEAFMEMFNSRIVPDALFLLDEPEAPFSPLRQLAFISVLNDAVKDKNAQFIIATHSPIIMAYPGASILSFDEDPVSYVGYEELEHVRLMRDFLNNKELYLKNLI